MERKELKKIMIWYDYFVIDRNNGKYTLYYGDTVVWNDWYNDNYDWLECALAVVKRLPKSSQNLDILITLRQAIREDYVQGWNIQDEYLYDFLEENDYKMTVKQLDLFLEIAKNNDKKHHGVVTF